MTETNLKFALSCEDLQKLQAIRVHPAQLGSSYGLDTSDEDAVRKSARELDSTCELKTLKANPGEFFRFFGQVWHSIENRSQHRRSAITFQYSRTRAKVKMPAPSYEFPFVWDSRPVPCCLVRGSDEYGRNLLVNAAPADPGVGLVEHRA